MSHEDSLDTQRASGPYANRRWRMSSAASAAISSAASSLKALPAPGVTPASTSFSLG